MLFHVGASLLRHNSRETQKFYVQGVKAAQPVPDITIRIYSKDIVQLGEERKSEEALAAEQSQA